MIIENQNAPYRFSAKIGWHRRFNDSEDFLSPGAGGIVQNRTANVSDPNPFTKFLDTRARSCARRAVVIKPWHIHTGTVWPLVSSSLLRRCGIF